MSTSRSMTASCRSPAWARARARGLSAWLTPNPTAPSDWATRRMVAGWRDTTLARPWRTEEGKMATPQGILAAGPLQAGTDGAPPALLGHTRREPLLATSCLEDLRLDTKACPFCGEEIKSVAVRCKH